MLEEIEDFLASSMYARIKLLICDRKRDVLEECRIKVDKYYISMEQADFLFKEIRDRFMHVQII